MTAYGLRSAIEDRAHAEATYRTGAPMSEPEPMRCGEAIRILGVIRESYPGQTDRAAIDLARTALFEYDRTDSANLQARYKQLEAEKCELVGLYRDERERAEFQWQIITILLTMMNGEKT